MSELRVQVHRPRPTCPYCRAAVDGGDVWLCPACFAPHHRECQGEHPGCAACGHGRPRPRPAPQRLMSLSAARRLERASRTLLFVGLVGAALCVQVALLLVLYVMAEFP